MQCEKNILGQLSKHFCGRRRALKDESLKQILEDFGYAFNEDGELKNIETNARFECNVKLEDPDYNQRRAQ